MVKLQTFSFWARVIAISALLTSLNACKANNSDALHWTEDVNLPDGRMVTLTRYQEFNGPHELGDTPTESDYYFEFKNPDTGEHIKWLGQRNLNSLALFSHKGVFYLLTTPWYGDSGFYHNSPNPPYLLYSYKSKWDRVELTEIPIKRIRVNMVFAPKEMRELIKTRHHISSSVSSNSFHKNMPYWIDFNRMERQTFGNESIGHYDDLVH
jgi:hypothetical protein